MMGAVMIAGFTLGAAGSLHCVGMCGPLSLALPVYHLSKAKKFFSILLYQAGRITTYTMLGLIIGLAGRRIYIAGYQQVFSIAMGILVLGLAVIYFLQKRSVNIPVFNRFYLKVQKIIGSLLHPIAIGSSKGLAGFLLIGMANGLLPCGMVYIAIASVLSFTEIGESAAFMAMFGAGTLPAMMLVAYAGQMMKPGVRLSMRKAVPVLVSLVGIILILRGLNLGIPFISPELPAASGDAVICHP